MSSSLPSQSLGSADVELLTLLVRTEEAMALHSSNHQFDDVLNAIRPAVASVKTVSPKNLPGYRGDLFEDCEESLEKLQGCADVDRWNNEGRKALSSCSQKSSV